MYATTGGTNTHKGAILILGLLVAAASHTNEVEPFQLAKVAGSISRMPDIARPELVSHGAIVRIETPWCGFSLEEFARSETPSLFRDWIQRQL